MMKKLLMAIMVMASSLAASAQTATDMSSVDNGLYVAKTTIKAGTSAANISVCMKNAVDVQTIGMDVYVPEGITFAKNSSGKPRATMSKARTNNKVDEDDEPITAHTLFCAFQSDGALRIGILGVAGLMFDGNDGEIATIKVDVAETTPAGEYIIKIGGQEFSNRTGKVVPADTYSVIVVEASGTGINEVAADAAGKGVKKVVKDGKIVIVKDGKEYNANGSELK